MFFKKGHSFGVLAHEQFKFSDLFRISGTQYIGNIGLEMLNGSKNVCDDFTSN